LEIFTAFPTMNLNCSPIAEKGKVVTRYILVALSNFSTARWDGLPGRPPADAVWRRRLDSCVTVMVTQQPPSRNRDIALTASGTDSGAWSIGPVTATLPVPVSLSPGHRHWQNRTHLVGLRRAESKAR
jgi:hypothetical protein